MTASRPPIDSSTKPLPLAELLPEGLTAVDVFLRLAHLPHTIFFDSASCETTLGRYSFVATDPFHWFETPAVSVGGHATTNRKNDALSQLETLWNQYQAKTRTDLPPFQGGIAGLFGYELGSTLEKVPDPSINDLPTPALAVGAYDVVIAIDHEQGQGWIISQGFPETDESARRERAAARIAQMRDHLSKEPRPSPIANTITTPRKNLAPQFQVGLEGVTSNLSRDDYHRMIARAVEYIHAGDIFQVNLAQRLLAPAHCDSIQLYLQLRNENPAPYAGFLNLGEWQICSTSPECFLTLRNGEVETRPIKGTRGRSQLPEADLFAGDDLQQSEKDRAENVMIVDLMRNDLSRVCTDNSLQVTQLCQLETYAYVKHLVSTVRGHLRPKSTPFDLLRACFPGGSITGAPKIRAMQIIAELEPTARGPYCGSLGYIAFDGQMDSSILIRTVTAGHAWWQIPVGGGIVAQSNAENEYRETWHKAHGMLLGTTPQ